MAGSIRADYAAAQRKTRSRSGQAAPASAQLGATFGRRTGVGADFQNDPAFQRRKRQQDRDRRQQRKEKARGLEDMLKLLGLGGAGTASGGAQMTAPEVPLAPVAGNAFAGAEKAAATQAAESRRYLASQLRGEGPKATGSAGATMGGYREQVAQQLAAFSSGARHTQDTLRAKYLEDELRRKGDLAKARYERDLEQQKLNQQVAGLGQLSLSMIEALESSGLDSAAFANDPIGAAVALGRLKYARQQEMGGLTASQIAQLAELGLNPYSFSSPADAALAIGDARRGMYGSPGTAQDFLRWLQGGR